jgi:hypothetical protein
MGPMVSRAPDAQVSVRTLLAAALVFAGAALVHLAAIDRPLLDEGPASAAPADLLRAALLAVAAVLFVGALGPPRQDLSAAPSRIGIALAWSSLVLGAAAALVFLADPRVFFALAEEGSIVETASAAIALAASAAYARVALRARALAPALAAWSAALAAVTFLIGMEEISWFQQLVAFESPASFGENLQGELNLHNFATNKFENAYYFGTFLLFVVAPFLVERLAPASGAVARRLVPGRGGGWAPARTRGVN